MELAVVTEEPKAASGELVIYNLHAWVKHGTCPAEEVKNHSAFTSEAIEHIVLYVHERNIGKEPNGRKQLVERLTQPHRFLRQFRGRDSVEMPVVVPLVPKLGLRLPRSGIRLPNDICEQRELRDG